MKVWIDPAEGWKYGFPVIWDQEEETAEELLDRHNYPKELRDLSIWMWEAEDDS